MVFMENLQGSGSQGMATSTENLSDRSAPQLWGELVLGPYAVGFQSFIIRDYSRRYELPGNGDGSSAGRPLAVQVWYPAQPIADWVVMPYKGYLNLASDDPALQKFVEAQNTFVFETECDEVMDQRWADLEPADAKAFEAFLQTPTACYPEAPPLTGPFPALIYHQGLGGCLVDNPILLEFLASYGYVVATSTFQPAHGLTLGVDYDLDRSIKDLACIVNALCEKFAVDPARIGLLGHSYGASAVLCCAAEAEANLRAVVSLDSTREWDNDCEPLFSDVSERLRKASLSMPSLMVFSMAKPTVRFHHYDDLAYCDRYYLTVQHLQHNDFVTPGPTVTSCLAERTKEQTQLIRSTSKAICEGVLAFFEAYLKEDQPNPECLRETLEALNQDLQALTLQVRQATPKPMPAKQFLETFLTQRAEGGCETVAQAAAEVEPDSFLEVGRALQERGLLDDALLLYQTLNQQFPDYSSAYEASGDIYHYRFNDKPKARVAYQMALEALPRDLTLSADQKAYRQRYLTEDIEALKEDSETLK